MAHGTKPTRGERMKTNKRTADKRNKATKKATKKQSPKRGY